MSYFRSFLELKPKNDRRLEAGYLITKLELLRTIRIERRPAVLPSLSPRSTFVHMTDTTHSHDNDGVPSVGNIHPELIRQHLKSLARRQLWLGSTTVAVVLLLTIGVASFAFPGLLKIDPDYGFYLNQGIRALVGFVLVFSVYVVYQQMQIGRMRDQIATQIDCLAKVETLASEVYKLAALDQLTGLYNRRSGEQRMAQEISRAQRHGRPLTVLLIDLDGLKKVNDTYGHAAGDAVLKGFADRIQRAIRGSDLAVRLGGDEFMAILPECRSEEVHRVLDRVRGLEVLVEGGKLRPTFSCGWTDYKTGEAQTEFIERADKALYVNKKSDKRGLLDAVPVPVHQAQT
jgi:diguanylate cyclase (GGDEF)-like protein